MSSQLTIQNREMQKYGFNMNSSKLPVPTDLESQITDSQSMFPDKSINRAKLIDVSGQLYDAIIAPDFGGDYNGSDAISQALNEGKRRLYIRSGTYYITKNIDLVSNCVLIGEDRYNCIIDCSLATTAGIVGSSNTNFQISTLTIKYSDNDGGIYLDGCSFFSIDNCSTDYNVKRGISISGSHDFSIQNGSSSNNTQDGIYIIGNIASNTYNYNIFNYTVNNNTLDGIELDVLTNGKYNYSWNIIGTICNDNVNGFYINLDYNEGYGFFSGCEAKSNSGDGFKIISKLNKLIGCTSTANTGIGFNIGGDDILCGCRSDNNSTEYTLEGSNIIVGNIFNYGVSVDPTTIISGDSYDVNSQLWSNIGQTFKNERRTVRMKNSSGGQQVLGSTVIFNAAADGDEFTTTTTQGDDLVIGMCAETIASTEYGSILVEGFTEHLKVNGTTDIAIGDFLGTYTTAGIAMKAAAGDMAFAIALEAYTGNDSNGIINALLVSPRKL